MELWDDELCGVPRGIRQKIEQAQRVLDQMDKIDYNQRMMLHVGSSVKIGRHAEFPDGPYQVGEDMSTVSVRGDNLPTLSVLAGNVVHVHEFWVRVCFQITMSGVNRIPSATIFKYDCCGRP